MQLTVFPVPIRHEGDYIVAQVHVPHDLSLDEADKICRVVRALAKPQSDECGNDLNRPQTT